MRVGNVVGMCGRMVFTRPIEEKDLPSIKRCADCGQLSTVLVIETAPGDVGLIPPRNHNIHCWGWCGACEIGA